MYLIDFEKSVHQKLAEARFNCDPGFIGSTLKISNMRRYDEKLINQTWM